MKRTASFIAGLILGLLLPYLFGRQLSVTVTHKLDLPLKKISQ